MSQGAGPPRGLYDLRITRRCREEDLRADPDATLLELRGEHPSVELFALGATRGARTVGARLPLNTLECLALHEDEHAALALMDDRVGVCWLLAVASGVTSADEGVWRTIAPLAQLVPTRDDYLAYEVEEMKRNLPPNTDALSSISRIGLREIGHTHTCALRSGGHATVVYEAARDQPDLLRVRVAIAARLAHLPAYLAAVVPPEDIVGENWRRTRDFPRELDDGEVAFTCLRRRLSGDVGP